MVDPRAFKVSDLYWKGASQQGKDEFRVLQGELMVEPDNLDALTSFGALLWLHFHETDAAIEILQRVISGEKVDSSRPYFWLAKCYFHDRADSTEAAKYLELGLEKDPNNPESLSLLGSCYRDMGESAAEYLPFFLRAVQAAPSWPHIRIVAIQALCQARKRGQALKLSLSGIKRGCPSVSNPTTVLEEYFEHVVTGRAESENGVRLCLKLLGRCFREQ